MPSLRVPTHHSDDVSCTSPGAASQTVALVADTCGDCYGADLAISTPLFQNISGRAPGSNPAIQVSWQFLTPAECAPYIQVRPQSLCASQGGVRRASAPHTCMLLNCCCAHTGDDQDAGQARRQRLFPSLWV